MDVPGRRPVRGLTRLPRSVRCCRREGKATKRVALINVLPVPNENFMSDSNSKRPMMVSCHGRATMGGRNGAVLPSVDSSPKYWKPSPWYMAAGSSCMIQSTDEIRIATYDHNMYHRQTPALQQPQFQGSLAMERVLFSLHQRLCQQALNASNAHSRRILEHGLLMLAMGSFGVLLVAHLSFVYRGHPHMAKSAVPPMSLSSASASTKYNIPTTCFSTIEGYRQMNVDVTHLSILDEDLYEHSSKASFAFLDDDLPQTRADQQVVPRAAAYIDLTDSCRVDDFLYPQGEHNMTRPIYSYSTVKGYLMLSPSTLRERNLTVQHVLVSKRDVHCFGEPFLQLIVHGMTGPETVGINWILGLGQPLYVYNPRTDTIIDLEQQQFQVATSGRQFYYYTSQSFGEQFLPPSATTLSGLPWYNTLVSKLAVVIKTSFLFFTATTLISFTLRETQERMLSFTHQLQMRVRCGLSVGSLVLTHLVENLVFVPHMIGLCFFLTEFYQGDKFLAFVILSLVWVCEVFSVVSLRSAQGQHFFPRIFFLLFSLFHYYLFSFPFGFSYTALSCTILFMAHSMLFFWHRFELPAVAHGHVTFNHPRLSIHQTGAQQTPTRPPPAQPASIPMLHDGGSQTNSLSSTSGLPQVTLSPRGQHPPHENTISRQATMNSQTSESNASSRLANSSAAVLFHAGSMDDDDRDADGGSYLFFMNGEVVMHRRPPSSMSLRSGLSANSTSHYEDVDDTLNRHQVPTACSTVSPSSLHYSSQGLVSVASATSLSNVVEPSALQAIMEVTLHMTDQNGPSESLEETPRTPNQVGHEVRLGFRPETEHWEREGATDRNDW